MHTENTHADVSHPGQDWFDNVLPKDGSNNKGTHCNLYEGMGVKHKTKTQGCTDLESTNHCAAGFMQPKLILEYLVDDPQGFTNRIQCH